MSVHNQQVNEVLKQRQEIHGDFLKNFQIIGKIWGALLGIEPIEAYKVALMMDAFKTVRAIANPNHEDNWIDKQGYTDHAIICAAYETRNRGV